MPPRKFAFFQPFQRALDRKIAELRDIQVVHPHGERVGVQTRSVAVGAVHGLPKTRQSLTPGITVLHTAFKQGDDAGPAFFAHAHLSLRAQGVRKMLALIITASAKGHAAAHPVAAQAQRGARGAALFILAIKKGGKRVFAELLQRRGKLKFEAFAQSLERVLIAAEHLVRSPGQQCARVQRKPHVGRNEARLKIIHAAEAHATRAGALRPVE